jgi:hypothetical protein
MKRLLSSLLFASSLLSACQLRGPELLSFEICDDGLDNDGNGQTDCDDADCLTFNPPICSQPEVCDDNIDNDFNGDQDCQDDACAGTTDCMCIVTQAVFAIELPLVIEGDSADGVFAANFFGCQTGDAREAFFNLDFTVDRVDVLLEPLDDVEMVLQTSGECGENFSFSCIQNPGLDVALPVFADNVDVSNGSILFFAGAREAGQTGRFRLTFSLPE